MKVRISKKTSALLTLTSIDILESLSHSQEPLCVTQLSKELKRRTGVIALALKYLYRHGWISAHHGKWRYKRAIADKDAYFITKSGKKHLGKHSK